MRGCETFRKTALSGLFMLLAGIADTVLLHRVIAGTPVGMETDHRDRDGLNNRRNNLRNATIAQNRQNAAISADNTSG